MCFYFQFNPKSEIEKGIIRNPKSEIEIGVFGYSAEWIKWEAFAGAEAFLILLLMLGAIKINYFFLLKCC
jgi:hypothetical protein